ncbi:MAG: hypothetical protein ACKVUS_02210 [Saprospiraceae bacterium]
MQKKSRKPRRRPPAAARMMMLKKMMMDYETSFVLNQKHEGKHECRPEIGDFQKKCGEETSPTPQMDWFLAHGLKTAFGLKFLHGVCPRFSKLTAFGVSHRQQRSCFMLRQLLCHN